MEVYEPNQGVSYHRTPMIGRECHTLIPSVIGREYHTINTPMIWRSVTLSWLSDLGGSVTP